MWQRESDGVASEAGTHAAAVMLVASRPARGRFALPFAGAPGFSTCARAACAGRFDGSGRLDRQCIDRTGASPRVASCFLAQCSIRFHRRAPVFDRAGRFQRLGRRRECTGRLRQGARSNSGGAPRRSLCSSGQRLSQRPLACHGVSNAIARLTIAVSVRPLTPALQLVVNGNLPFFVDAIAVLETDVPLVDRLVRRRASAQSREDAAHPSEARVRP